MLSRRRGTGSDGGRHWTIGAAGLCGALILASCAGTVGKDSTRVSGSPASKKEGPPPAAAPSDLREAAAQAARAGHHKVEYLLDTATRRGRLVYATSGDRTSWRLEQNISEQGAGRARSATALAAFVLETPTTTVFCLLEQAWKCFEGDTSPASAPALFDKRSFDFLSIVAPSIPPESYKQTETTLAGYPSACFDIVPQAHLFSSPGGEAVEGEGPVPPLASVEGVDSSALEALRNSLVVEVLYRGGTLCFGSGILLKMAILDEELFTIQAAGVSAPLDSDFDPPVTPEPVETPSPFPSVIEAS